MRKNVWKSSLNLAESVAHRWHQDHGKWKGRRLTGIETMTGKTWWYVTMLHWGVELCPFLFQRNCVQHTIVTLYLCRHYFVKFVRYNHVRNVLPWSTGNLHNPYIWGSLDKTKTCKLQISFVSSGMARELRVPLSHLGLGFDLHIVECCIFILVLLYYRNFFTHVILSDVCIYLYRH